MFDLIMIPFDLLGLLLKAAGWLLFTFLLFAVLVYAKRRDEEGGLTTFWQVVFKCGAVLFIVLDCVLAFMHYFVMLDYPRAVKELLLTNFVNRHLDELDHKAETSKREAWQLKVSRFWRLQGNAIDPGHFHTFEETARRSSN